MRSVFVEDNAVLILNTTKAPVKQKHIGYFTRKGCDATTIELFEVVECYYEHPEEPNASLIPRLEYYSRGCKNVEHAHAALLNMLDWAQQAITRYNNGLTI